MKKSDSLTADDLVKVAKKIISDAGINFTLSTFTQFCRQMKLEQLVALSYHHQSNSQVEEWIKYIKHTIKKCLDNNNNVNLLI